MTGQSQGDHSRQRQPKYGSEKKGAPTSYFMVAAKDRIRVNCDLRHVNVVLCCDPKAFTHTNPLDGMAPGGSPGVGVRRDRRAGLGAAAAVGAQADCRQQHSRLHAARLQIARNATDRADLQLRMQGNAFLGAFFAVSPLLEEFGITQEKFREVVYKQYVKKFGKLGEAVVAVEHGSDDQGLRDGHRDQDRRTDRSRSLQPARAGAAADSRRSAGRRGRKLRQAAAALMRCPQDRPSARRSTCSRPSIRSSARTTATISRRRRSRRWA
jgi:Pyruvate/2-oxoacid:ferredoxin oxidoreductase gamma subunit